MRKILFFLTAAASLLSSCTTVGTSEPNPYLPSDIPETEESAEEAQDSQVMLPFIQFPFAEPTPTPTPGPSKTPPPATYYFFEEGVNPLTGLPVNDPSLLQRRPVMVKVSNWPREGRPHAGLMKADIVFEYFIGYQMNRFLGVYYGDNAERIGPVRSGRLVDAQLAELYQGLLAYGNADPQVDEVLIDVLDERALAFNELPCPQMCGRSTYSATGVFANSTAITNYADDNDINNWQPDLRGFYFQSEPPEGDAYGRILRVEYANFSIMEWRYDDETGAYNLWMEREGSNGLAMALMTDRNSGNQVAFDNVIVMFAEYIEYAPSLHDIVLQGVQGYKPALLFRDGMINYGTWRTPDPRRPIIFETPDGESLPLKPGNTWIVILGEASQTVQPAGGEWTIYFDLP